MAYSEIVENVVLSIITSYQIDGLSLAKTAEKYQVKTGYVIKILKHNGIPLRQGKTKYDLTGKKFNLLTVLKKNGFNKFGHTLWLCTCECGSNTVVNTGQLISGKTQSCGHLIYRTGTDTHGFRHGHCVDHSSSPAYQMLSNAKQRAKRYGIPCNIELSDIVIPETCPIFPDIKLVCNKGGGSPSEDSPSLDKIVPELGYIKGNVRVISQKANLLKSNATVATLQRLIDYIEGKI